MANQSFADMIDRPLDTIPGNKSGKISSFTERELAEISEQDRQVLEKGLRLDLPEQAITLPGGIAQFRHLIKLPLKDEQERVVGVVALSEDITRRKHLEEHTRQAHNLETVGRLAGGVAHEFNNLLQIISGFTQLTMDETTPDDRRFPYLERTLEAAERATTLVGQILGISRGQQIRPVPLDLNSLIPAMESLISVTAGKKIQVLIRSEPGLEFIHADEAAFQQVLLNLLLNARDAICEEGEIVLATENVSFDEAFCVDHPWAMSGEFVKVSVSDTGQGMSGELREKIFDPFFTTRDCWKGAGLGLSVVSRFVEQLNGFIHVTSNVGDGSTFDLFFPVNTRESRTWEI